MKVAKKDFRKELKRNFLADDKQLNDYLQGIIKKLLANSPAWFSKTSYKIHLIFNNGFGAESYPSGDIIVDTSFLCSCQSEDVLAWVLSHEMNHVGFEHYLSETLVLQGPQSFLFVKQTVADEIRADWYAAEVIVSSGYLIGNSADLYSILKDDMYHTERKARTDFVMQIQSLWQKVCPNCNPTPHPLPEWYGQKCSRRATAPVLN
jgi:hypothetical protein